MEVVCLWLLSNDSKENRLEEILQV